MTGVTCARTGEKPQGRTRVRPCVRTHRVITGPRWLSLCLPRRAVAAETSLVASGRG